MEFLKIENLCKVYGKGENQVTALDHVSLTIEKGDFTAIIGSSGSGKSTLLHAIAGVDVPTSGKIYLNGQDVYAGSNEKLAIFRRRQVGLIYQFHNLIPTLNVVENITLPILMDKRKVNQERLDDLLNLLGLQERKNHLPNQLSGGQQQRVAIGRALMNAPAVMLADEPTGSLDSQNGHEIMKLLKSSHEKYHQTLIIVTHDENIALQADRIICISDGKVARDEKAGETVMNIFNKVALQGLKKSRTRTFVTIIGVALSAALITAIATFGVSLLNYMIKGAAQKNGDWHIAFLDVPSSFVQERIQDKEVADTVTFDNIGYAALNGSKNPDKPYLFIVGFGEETFQTLPVKLLSGRMPENSGEILVSASVAANGGVKFSVGDTLSLDVGSRMNGSKTLTQHDPYSYENEALAAQEKRTYTVVGICQRPVFEERTAPGYTLITKADEQSRTNNYTLFVKLEKPHTARVYANSTAENYAYIFNDDVLRFMGISNDNVFNTFLYSVAGIVIIIIMIGSVFLIHNAFHISLNERTHQFGILMSVGATEKQLRNSVLFEGLCVGAAGIPIGVITGIFGIKIVLSVVARNFGNIMYDTVPLTLVVSVPAIVGASVISLLTILISAYIPARKAAGIPVMECIRQTNEVKTESKTVKTSKFTEKIYGLEGTLALKNFKRNKRRYRSIVLSLILSVVLFIATSAFVADLKQAAGQTASVTTYDIGFATQDMEEHEMLALYDKLKTADSVYDSSYQALMTYSCTAKAGDFSEAFLNQTDSHLPDETVDLTMQIQFIDDNAYQNLLKDLGLSAEEYTGQNAKLFACAKIEDNSSQVKKSGEFVNMFTNSSMNFAIVPKTEEESEIGDEKNVTITFADFVPPDTLPVLEITESTPYIFMVMAPYSLKDTFVSPDTRVDVKGLTFQSKNPTRSAEEMEAMILSEGITADYTLYNTREMLEENSNMIFIANVFSYTFIVMISLIAVANVFNTISTNIKLRKRELAMLRSVGMSERDFQKMMNFECIFYGMRALFVGLPIGILSSWLIYKGMYSGGADAIDFVMPWVSIGISIVGVLFIVFITMLYSTNKIKKENIIDALRDDMA